MFPKGHKVGSDHIPGWEDRATNERVKFEFEHISQLKALVKTPFCHEQGDWL
jgi:hypothetical protein